MESKPDNRQIRFRRKRDSFNRFVYCPALTPFLLLVLLLISGCEEQEWNNPYPYEKPDSRTLYSAFSERPKHLDPAISYTVSEAAIISQIYEPPLQYHYLKRPYVLEPLTAETMPEVQYYNETGQLLPATASNEKIAYSEYIIRIKPGIFYQAHPAFAKKPDGQYRYLNLSEKEIETIHSFADFKETGTRELIAEDYIYQIKRLAEPSLNSPIYGLMSQYIEGLSDLRQSLMLERQQQENKAKSQGTAFLGLENDLRPYLLLGASVIDRYQYRIRIKGKYPQFRFWLAMNFFAPIPWEVALFYAQPSLQKHNISLDWFPVGTGPFLLAENNPDRRMSLKANPNYREEFFPSQGSEQDKNLGLLVDAGKKMPLIEQVVFSLERESIPFWNKFLQGYYDISPIASDNFSSAIRLNSEGELVVTDELQKKGIRLNTSVSPNVFYWGFNMLDKTVGGGSLQTRKLRHAISMAFDVEEFISIFLNGRGVLAKGPIPPDIFGYETQLQSSEIGAKPIATNNISNKDLTSKTRTDHKAAREKVIAKAKKLLNEAGYSKGLTLYLDTVASGDPDEIAIHAWLKDQFEKIGLQLVIRGSQYNHFQDKILQGDTQIFSLGWNADYPDPENFLFLFYGPNASAQFGGENKTNYSNPEYDRLFEKMRLQEDSPERLQTIAEMIKILQQDRPWIWGFFPKSFVLYQGWVRTTKPSSIINNNIKYFNVHPELREKCRAMWNQPLLWPLFILCILLALFLVCGGIWYRSNQTKQKERK